MIFQPVIKHKPQKRNWTASTNVPGIAESKILLTDTYETNNVIGRIGESIVATAGNFSLSNGKAKSRKTFNVSALTAAALSGEFSLNYEVNLPEDQQEVYYFDTEQSKYHCHKVLTRIVRMAGLPLDKHPENLQFFALRKFSPAERLAIIEKEIYNNEGVGLVIIDGVRDLVNDINSPHESTEVSSKLMKWTDDLQCHMHLVLHQNKGDSNSRGHIGTELNNKAESVISISKDDNNPDVTKVESTYLRDKDFDPFAFSIDDKGLPYLLDDFQVQSRQYKVTKPDEIPINTHKEDIINRIFINGEELSYSECWRELKSVYKAYGPMGDNKAKDFLKFYLENELIKKSNKKYIKNY